MLLQLAFRNIWRNKRRTLITIGAVSFAVFLASFTNAFQKGAWDSIIDGAVTNYFGLIQIHGEGYSEEQIIDKSIPFTDAFKNLPDQIPAILAVNPRLESFALASEGDKTHGALVIGISPPAEDAMSNISAKIIAGAYLTEQDKGVIVAEGLAKKLGLEYRDTLVLISQGYHGANAAGKYPIKGIFKLELPDFNKSLVYMPLAEAQYFYNAPNRITTLALTLDDKKNVPTVINQVKAQLGDNPTEPLEILPWQEIIPELVEARELDTAGNVIIIGILYLLIAFAIFGTILMMVKERSYEFGVLTAIGMKRWQLFSVTWLETVIVAILGALIGILLSIPIVYYFNTNPVDVAVFGEEAAVAYEKMGIQGTLSAAFEWSVFFRQAFIIFLMTCLLALYPFLKIMRLQPVQAMRE